MRLSPVVLFALFAALTSGQEQRLNQSRWSAKWIDAPQTDGHAYGVYLFRRVFELETKPDKFVVNVSGDNRYELSVNGVAVSHGPASGEPMHWNYETVDLAPQLKAGRNVLAATVWNDGKDRAVAFLSVRTGFVLEGLNAAAIVNSGPQWKVFRDPAYSPQTIPQDQVTGYYVAPPNERFNAAQHPWGWEKPEFDDHAWPAAHEISSAVTADANFETAPWRLVPRSIPLPELRAERFAAVRQSTVTGLPDGFVEGRAPLVIPAKSKWTLLLDQGYLTTAYPDMTVTGGRGASLELHYGESLYLKASYGRASEKGNRNDVDGKVFLGPHDTYLADGGIARRYRTLYWRTYRYIKLEIETTDEALRIDDIHSTFTSYPFVAKAKFEIAGDADANAEAQRILNTGFRTARLCAHETYMDCPFYEQLQYAGDARIQMLVSLYMTGDARLMKRGIASLDASRIPEGITQSRAPAALAQFIPPFSLWWIGMVHDYMRYVDDPAFVREMLPGVRAVLSYFARHQKDSGSLRAVPWWNFADWVPKWRSGIPPSEPDGSSSAIFDLQLLMAYQWADGLESFAGNAGLAAEYRAAARKLKQTIWSVDWDESRGLIADQPSRRTFSQHANALAILAGVVPAQNRRAVMEKALRAEGDTAQATIYFKAYTNEALREAGLGDRLWSELGPWRRMLGDGLTTWAETDDKTRSDCHAWGASPNYELLRTVAGIDSMAPGFAQVRVAPSLGDLPGVSARMPHPKGEVRVDLKKTAGGGVAGEVELPRGVTGRFEWRGRSAGLKAGVNRVAL